MRRLILSLIASTALASSGAYAVTWKTNDDGSVNAESFVAGENANLAFNRFDDDNDGALTPTEVGLTEPDAVFRRADRNGDGYLTRSEVNIGTVQGSDAGRSGSLETRDTTTYGRDDSTGDATFRRYPQEGPFEDGREIPPSAPNSSASGPAPSNADPQAD